MRTVLAVVSLLLAGPAYTLDIDECIDEGDCAIVQRSDPGFGCLGSDSDSCRWNTLDYTLQGTFFALTAADYATTAKATRQNREGWYEANPLLGRHPSQTSLAIYNLGWSALHTGVALVLPKPWRTIWQSTTILIGIDTMRVWGGSVYFPW
jgi:hypothetical protein